MKPTLKDPKLRTYKKLFGFLDVIDVHTPWRAPGFAPVFDPCGVAGGVGIGIDPGHANPPPAGVKQGLSGQDVPALLGVKTEWRAGSTQEVSWGIDANHGGGYAYRLCPITAGVKSTEECFQQHHLQFVGEESWIQFGNNKANRTAIPAARVSTGTNPSGSQWTKNPIPACGGLDGGGQHLTKDKQCSNPQFDPPLANVVNPHPTYAPTPGLYGWGIGGCDPEGQPGGFVPCSPDELAFWTDRFNFNIIDQVLIPSNLPAGEYLLSFRWDSEQTPQVWAECADVTIVQADMTLV